MENIILYILIFIIGTLFGSFSTLAVYRLPKHENITHKRSYCPNCNHKLTFFDMIPVLSYIFLGGKCRYCKQKIRIRYLILEIAMGTIFLLFALSLNLKIYPLQIDKFVYLIAGLLYLAGLIIIAGIDKENRRINRPILVYEIVILSIYMIYLYIVEHTNIYRYVIYLIVLIILFLIDCIILRKKKKESYVIGIVILSIIQAIFSYTYGFYITITITLIAIALKTVLMKIIMKDSMYYKKIPIGYFLIMANTITIIMINFIALNK